MRLLPFNVKPVFKGLVLLVAFVIVSRILMPQINWVEVRTAADTRAAYQSSERQIFDRNGDLLHVVRHDFKKRMLDWTDHSKLSPALIEAVIRAEDKRFPNHDGVDDFAMARALWQGLIGSGRQQGASTITMQLAGLLAPKLRGSGGGRTLWQKASQILHAWSIERSWVKDDILEAYLNLVSFRGEFVGISAASEAFFGKRPNGLNRLESALLAVMLRSPNSAPEQIAQRACWLLDGLDCDTLRELATRSLTPPFLVRRNHQLIPHLAAQTDAEGDIQVTLDKSLQVAVRESVRRHISILQERNVNDAAVLVLDNKTGKVLAYLGSSGDLSETPHVDGVLARRQAGSTLKPFVYALALEQKFLTAGSLLDDSAVEIPIAAGGVYRPRNYDKRFHGPVTVRDALASSLNVPAIRAIIPVGPEAMVERMEELGFQELMSPEFYGVSLALGSADVSLWDLTNAYRTLANAGRYSNAEWRNVEPAQEKQIIDPGAAFIIGDILSDRKARALSFGFESPLATPFFSAVKTGTSKDMRDNWTVGFSQHYTVGVWVGNFSGEPMWNVTGITGAGPIWREVMEYLHRDRNSHSPAPSGTVVLVDRPDGTNEWYLEGTEPYNGAKGKEPLSQILPKILYPTDGSILAIDPNIPDPLQRLVFKARGGSGFRWELRSDGRIISHFDGTWKPVAGRYQLTMMSKAGIKLDTIRFEVR